MLSTKMITTALLLNAANVCFAAQGGSRPCDLYAAGGTPCVAAHSTVRALYSSYVGNLYQVKRASDGMTKDIATNANNGYSNSMDQVKFCSGTDCVLQRIYDQSPEMNHLDIAPPGGAHREEDVPCNITKGKQSANGNTVFGAYFEGGMGYRRDNTTGVAKGDEAQTMYMVVSGTHYNDRCCFDYGNAEVDNLDDGAGTMEAVYFGNAKGGLNHGGRGEGPWIMADMEQALWGANVVKSNEAPINHDFVTAMVKGDSGNHWAIKGGNAAEGNLTVFWDGTRAPGYHPMKKQGAIILGIGGDNSDGAVGTFYEGVSYADRQTEKRER